jgi:hypothetical protein
MSMTSTRKAIIVLGMHRSGTSATAGMLGKMGCDLPEDLMKAADTNEKGFFESNKVVSLNDEILRSAQMSWSDLKRFPDTWHASPTAQEFAQNAKRILLEEYGASRLFVLKDPRHCRLVPFWEDVLADQGVKPKYLCIHRNPFEVAASLMRRDEYEPICGQFLWLRHVLDSEISTRGKERIFVSYDQVLSDWRALMGHISTGLNLVFPCTIQMAALSIDNFLSQDLKHFSSKKLKLSQIQQLTDWQATTLEVLDRWSTTGENSSDHAILDSVSDSINAASNTLVPALDALLLRYREFERPYQQQPSDLQKLSAQLHQAEHSLHLAWADRKALQMALDTQIEELHRARSHPLRTLRVYWEYQILSLLSSSRSPLPEKTKLRFARSAYKRDPNIRLV